MHALVSRAPPLGLAGWASALGLLWTGRFRVGTTAREVLAVIRALGLGTLAPDGASLCGLACVAYGSPEAPDSIVGDQLATPESVQRAQCVLGVAERAVLAVTGP